MLRLCSCCKHLVSRHWGLGRSSLPPLLSIHRLALGQLEALPGLPFTGALNTVGHLGVLPALFLACLCALKD